MLRAPDIRLISLVGPPGVGKTRLSIEAAARAQEDFADGACFVPLAPLRAATQVGPAIAQALGLHASIAPSAMDKLAHYLRGKQLLLVLDNFEHVIEAAGEVAALLQRAPALKVLATSRALLRLSAEHVFDVPPLAVPAEPRPGEPARHAPRLPDLARCASVALFVERARGARVSFQLDAANAPAVAELCRRLDGLPLAIELAASRARAYQPQAIVDHLDHRSGALLTFLSTGPSDLPPRQRVLRRTIGWSYELLGPAEQRLFRRLGVFAGGCALEAAQAVCGEDDASVEAGLELLVMDSLLEQAEDDSGQPRFRMLETLREFALEQLEASGEAADIRRRHARYFAGKCDLRACESPDWPNGAALALLHWVSQERPNLYAALEWSKREDSEPMWQLSLASKLAWLSGVGGNFHAEPFDPGIEAELLASHARAAGAPLYLRARSMVMLPYLAMGRGDCEAAARQIGECVALSRQEGDRAGELYAAHTAAYIVMAAGDLATARAHVERQAELAQALGLRPLIANAWFLRGAITLEQCQPGRAEDMFAIGARLYRELGIQNHIGGAEADALAGQGAAAYERGEYGRACLLAEQALSMLERGRNRVMTMWQHLRAGRAALASGQLDLAGQRLTQGLTLLCEHQRPGRIIAFAHLAQWAYLRGDRRAYARLMGFAAAHADAAPRSRPVWLGVEEFRRRIGEANARLAEPDFAADWDAGQAMDEDQAIDFARATAQAAASHGGLAAEA